MSTWQNLIVNALLFVLLALLVVSGTLMWLQHDQYHNGAWMSKGFQQNESQMSWHHARK